MKSWLWFLGISGFLLIACGETNPEGIPNKVAPAIEMSVIDTPPPVELDVDPDYQEDQNNDSGRYKGMANPSQHRDTIEPLPIVHMGDKDFNPNREPLNRALEDSLWKVQTEQQRVRDSIWRAHHPPLPGDTVKSRQRK